jgi:hypothetical protein
VVTPSLEADETAMTVPPLRERYEIALERLKQAARRHRSAQHRRDPDLAEYASDVEAARRLYDAVRLEGAGVVASSKDSQASSANVTS